jgi:integrase
MAERRVERITKRAVDGAAPAAATYRLWDSELKGFGLKVTKNGVKTYFVWYRAGQGRRAPLREFTLGRHGVLAPDEARTQATKVLRATVEGADPQAVRLLARAELNVTELCDLYLAEGVATKKPATIATDKARLAAHIKPLLGAKPVSTVTSSDVSRFVKDVASGKTAAKRLPNRAELRARGLKGAALEKAERRRRSSPSARGGRGAATRTLGLLGAIFTFAVRRGLRRDNPVAGVERFKDRQSQRFLSADELARLGTALTDLAGGGVNAQGLAVIRLLALTGARKGEIEGLRWSEVDVERGCLRLADSKTGARVIPLGAPALVALQGIKRQASSPFVFPAQGRPATEARGKAKTTPKHYVGTPRVWLKVRAAAGLPDVRIHDLRHTYASLAAAGGQSLPLIGRILGHRDVKTTAQYAHLADDPVKVAADRTAAAAEAALAGKSAEVIPLRSCPVSSSLNGHPPSGSFLTHPTPRAFRAAGPRQPGSDLEA